MLFMVMLSLFVSCHKQDIGTTLPESDELYHSWRLTQKSYEGQILQPVDTYQPVVTFPRDGKFKHGEKDTSWCCGPFSFEGTNAAIHFNWDIYAPGCATINCRLSEFSGDINWEITILTATSLVLTGGKTVLTFVREP